MVRSIGDSPMKLLVVSHTPHYRVESGVAGWGPTVREIDWLSILFDEVIHVAPLHKGEAPRSAKQYQAANVRFQPLPPSGGHGLMAKAKILLVWPLYMAAIARGLAACDVAHVRCPANIGLLASFVLAFTRWPRTRWIKYAGNWRPEHREAWSYAFQRWWLRKPWHRGAVTVNGNWPGEPAHIHSFLNPCLSEAELEEAQRRVASKDLTIPIRLLFVGRVDAGKGIWRAVEITKRLLENDLPVVLDVVGDGVDRIPVEKEVMASPVGGSFRFHGWLPRIELEPVYERAHFLLLPTNSSEGWPKVLSESMAYGVVPVAGAVGCIPKLLHQFGTGRAHPAGDEQSFVRSISDYLAAPEVWRGESKMALAAARGFTYERHLERVCSLLKLDNRAIYSGRRLLCGN
jgi:glycosyltransferase involved in cell wall biosynthesis